MKIGFVLDDSLDKFDGVQQYVMTLGKWFTKQGHEVHYLVGHTERKDIKNIHSMSKNLQVHFNQNRMSTPYPASKKQIKQLLDKEKFDVLHVQLPYSPFLAGRIIKQAPARTAIIGTFHILPFSIIESLATRILAIMVRGSRKKFDHIFSVSGPAQLFAAKKFRVKSDVLPNAVAVQEFRQGRRLNRYNDGKKNIVYLGRLVERKGCMELLRAIEVLHVNKKLLNARVIIAGKGPLQDGLERYVKKHYLGHLVNFIGFVAEKNKPNLLASADVAVFPSTGGESFGIVLVEAMAAGSNVVIGGDNPGYRTVLKGRTNQLIDPDNTLEFAKQISKYLNNKTLIKSANKWQKSKVTEYDVRHVGQQLLNSYKTALLNKETV